MMETLMFGSLISAVDPVATLCSFSHLQVDRNLYTIIFGVVGLDPRAGARYLRRCGGAR
jgi:hypothetical protein